MQHFKQVAATAIFLVVAGSASAQNVLPVVGTEKIDSKERISGNAVVGFSYSAHCDVFDPRNLHVYVGPFAGAPGELNLTTQVTTVDGRYVFRASPENVAPSGWYRLVLEKTRDEKGSTDLDTDFLANYRNTARALVVSLDADNLDTVRLFPVHCGCYGDLKNIQLQVNAEGADAYYPDYDTEKQRRSMQPCDRVQGGSSFKFDHLCSLDSDDFAGVTEFPIIRKNGATIDDPIKFLPTLPPPPDATGQIYDRCEAERI